MGKNQVNKLLASIGPDLEPEPNQPKNDDGMKPLHVKFTDEQLAVVYEAIGTMKRARNLVNEPNPDLDANAVYYICSNYFENQESQNTNSQPLTAKLEHAL